MTTPDAVFQTLDSLDANEVNTMIRERDMQPNEMAALIRLGISIVAFGPPGTGKSTMGRIVARKNWAASHPELVRPDVADPRALTESERQAQHEWSQRMANAGLPTTFAGYTVLQCTEDAIGTAILEKMAIRTNENGQTYSVHEDGPGLVAVRRGAVFLVEEIDEASVGLSAMLTPFAVRGLADDVTLADGTTIGHGKGYGLFGTMNGELDDLHRRLQDRLAPFRVNVPSSGMLRALGPGLAKLCARMYYLAAKANEDVGVTYRQFELFRDARVAGLAPERAALIACRADRSAADAFLGVVRLAEAKNGSAQNA